MGKDITLNGAAAATKTAADKVLAPSVDGEPSAADLAQIDAARVAANSGDIAEYDAVVAAADTIYNRSFRIAHRNYATAIENAKDWDITSVRGVGMVENATTTRDARLTSALKTRSASIDAFSIGGGFLAQVGGDKAKEILGRKAQRQTADLLGTFLLAGEADHESITTPDGRVLMVATWIPLLEARMLALEVAASGQTDDVSDEDDAELAS